MNKAQWKALHDYCEDNCYKNSGELLYDLKRRGVVSPMTTVQELSEYVDGNTYDDMYEFLVRENE